MHNLLALSTLACLMVFFWMALRVGRARSQFNVVAPATTGHPEFERHFRVQANTLEGLVVFLPAMWLFSLGLDSALKSNLGDEVGAALSLVWVAGRIIYAQSYVKDPGSRSAGFGIQAFAMMTSLIGGLIVTVLALIRAGM